MDADEEIVTSQDVDVGASAPNLKTLGDPFLVHLRAEDDFDWETYIATYTGRTRIDRLLFLASHCPEVRKPCSATAIDLIKSTTSDVALYNRAFSLRNTFAQPGEPLLPKEDRLAPDAIWCERTLKENQNELEKLDLELRHYQNNLIKESVRMAHRDLGDHLRSTGNLSEALKYYIKTRDYCSTSEHVVEMCLNVIEVSLELKEYHSISAYVSKAEGLLDSYNPTTAAAASSSGKSTSRMPSGALATKGGTTSGADAIGALFRAGGSAGATNSATLSSATSQLNSSSTAATREAEAQGKRQIARIRSKLNVAVGIACMGMAKYQMAKRAFLDVDISTSDGFSNMASRADVALYTVLCSLAVLDRKDLKSSVLDREDIGAVLESDSQARELLETFFACEYERTMSSLDRVRTRALLDLHLSAHFQFLVSSITRRALRQFVQPFDSLRIERLAASMGWPGEEGVEKAVNELIGLIQSGEIMGKLDVIDKIYYAKRNDPRQTLFDSALETGQRRSTAAKHLLFRMNLLQSNLVVRLPNERAEA